MSPRSLLSPHPIVIFTGPFGSGKTEVAINYARAANAEGRRVCLVDLDIVTPYFRVGDYREVLAREGIEVIAAPGALASFELPALPPEISGALESDDKHAVLDVGGDPVGAQLLRTFAGAIGRRSYDLWVVANPYRPATPTAEALADHARAIEESSGLRLTGLIANPNLGALTEPADLERGLCVVSEAAQRLRLPVALAVEKRLLPRLDASGCALLVLTLIVRLPWDAASGQE